MMSFEERYLKDKELGRLIEEAPNQRERIARTIDWERFIRTSEYNDWAVEMAYILDYEPRREGLQCCIDERMQKVVKEGYRKADEHPYEVQD